ncbi:MAG: hypothetical protein U1E20_08040 [Methylocystis sp.]|uniref:hypothetical protein n=1 Tax=Methylocystis sp. TaxID=1911079 RepID=UPI0039602DDD
MRIFVRLSALLAFFAVVPTFAQGTAEQRAACESDAHRVCDAYIPDAIAIERCLRGNAASISAACRAELGLASPAPAAGKRRKR